MKCKQTRKLGNKHKHTHLFYGFSTISKMQFCYKPPNKRREELEEKITILKSATSLFEVKGQQSEVKRYHATKIMNNKRQKLSAKLLEEKIFTPNEVLKCGNKLYENH